MASTHPRAHRHIIAQQQVCLDRVPKPDEAPDVARKARRAWGIGSTSRLDLGRVCDRLGIEVSVLSMDVPDGGAQGFLIPGAKGGFQIEVDPEPTDGWQSVMPNLRKSLERHRKRFLVAHELAHTLFFEDGPDGLRRLVFDSAGQETFCDELARALLVPHEVAAELPFTPQGVVELQRRFDVSMEVALRSAVAAHGDTGVAWLLLQRDGESQIQWTSAERSLTLDWLNALRGLAKRATRIGSAKAPLIDENHPAQALHLRGRNQVVVTWDCPGFA